ncbi:MAG: alpha/beta hydrolase [Proteobacteria bacterium]|nr:alpha/beta hydrolase [Pseudomonadota bacterium]
MKLLPSLLLLAAFLTTPVAAEELGPIPATRFLARDGGLLAYDDSGGDGPLVIALPGMGDLRSQYRFLRPLLAAAGYRVVSMDVRGQGESSVAWADYSAHALGGDVLALMDHLGMPSAVVLGNSFAAGAALWAAHDAPERVRGTVSLGPVLRDLPASPWMRAVLWLGFAGPWRTAFWLKYWDSLFPPAPPPDQAAQRERLARSLREPGRMQALETMIGLSKADTDAILDQVRVPSLVVMGSDDPDFADPADEARLITALLRGESLLLEGGGHYPHVEAPELVAARVMAFLDGLR